MTENELRVLLVNNAKKFWGAKEHDQRHKKILEIYNGIKPLPRGYRVTENDAWCAATQVQCIICQCLTRLHFTNAACQTL